MKYYLDCKKIDTAINRAKKILIKRAEKNGIYENFGQSELKEIKDKFIDCNDYSRETMIKRMRINEFFHWCINYTI